MGNFSKLRTWTLVSRTLQQDDFYITNVQYASDVVKMGQENLD